MKRGRPVWHVLLLSEDYIPAPEGRQSGGCYTTPTHGSLTKAGKVRGQTPKLEAKPKRSAIPKVRNKRTYEKRFTLKRKPGQNWMRR